MSSRGTQRLESPRLQKTEDLKTFKLSCHQNLTAAALWRYHVLRERTGRSGWGAGGSRSNPCRLFKETRPSHIPEGETMFCHSGVFSGRSAPPLSLVPGSAQYYWSKANSKLANQQGSKLIIQLTVEKLKFFIKGKWNTVNLCFNRGSPHVAFTPRALWLLCEAVRRPKNDRSFTDLKIRQVLSFFFPPCMMIFPATITVTHSL